MSEVILVASGKGGTGKTTFTANLGATLAKVGYRVLLIDMDLGLRNLDLYLGAENKVVYNIMDVLSGVCRITKATVKVDGFDALYLMAASPRKDDRDITPLHMQVLCDKLKDIFDFIIIDCPAGIGDMLTASIAAANRAIIVTEPDVSAVRDSDITENFIIESGITNTSIVVNKTNPELQKAGFLPDLTAIDEVFRGPIVGVIEEDEAIRISTNRGVPIVRLRGTYLEQKYYDIVKRIFG